MDIYSIVREGAYFYSPTKIIFGVGSLKGLQEELKRLKIYRVLIIADNVLFSLNIIDRVLSYIRESIKSVEFYHVSEEPGINEFNKVAQFVRNNQFDGIIGIGGGSTLDTAKIASISSTNTGDILNFIGINKIKYRGIPLILIPTTAGSGSEVTRIAVVKVSYGGIEVKRGIASEYLLPDTVIVDPELTVTLPPKLTAITGLDALAHAIEGLTSTLSTPITDSLALTSITLILRYLYKAYINGNDIEARTYMSLAAMLGGLVVGNAGATLGHFIGETVGPIYNIPHGLAVGVSLPYIIKFYSNIIESKIAFHRMILNIDSKDAVRNIIKKLVRLYKEMNIPLSLRELNIDRNDLPKLAEVTLKYKVKATTPIDLDKETLLKIYERMWEGNMDIE
jgi:alcohol dehydrogenase class IV